MEATMYYYTKLTPTHKRPPLVYYCILHSVLCKPRVVGRSEKPEEQVFSNVVGIICFLVEIGLTDLPKFGGAMAPSAPPAPTVLLCTLNSASAHKINGSYTTVSISIKSRFANYFIIENKIEILVKSYQIEKLDTFGKWTFLMEVLVFTIQYQIGILFCSHH